MVDVPDVSRWTPSQILKEQAEARSDKDFLVFVDGGSATFRETSSKGIGSRVETTGPVV